jgi:hypothetical protein
VDTLKGVENLMRLREPAAWVALGALVLNLLLALVALATFDGPLASVAWVLSARLANPVPLVVLTVLVSFCVLRDRTPHARQLTLTSLVIGVVAVLLGLTFALLGFGATAPVLAVFAAIVQQAISVIAIGFLIKLVQLQAVPRRLPAGIGLAPYPSDALPPSPAPAAQDQHLQPTWHPDTAAGAAWRTAGDAAAGAPAAGWGADPSVGWQPIPTQPSGPEPNGPQPPGPQPNGPQFNAYGPTGRQPDRLEPQGPTPNDDRMRTTMPAPEPAPSVLKDPWADQAQRNLPQPVLDWWGRPQS